VALCCCSSLPSSPPQKDWYPRTPGDKSALSGEEAEFVAAEVWRQRSAVSVARMNVKNMPMALARWDNGKPSVPSNMVLVSDMEAEQLVAMPDGADGRASKVEVWGVEVVERVEARLAWVRDHMGYQ